MVSHWSLVCFTLLVQSAVGNLWCLLLALLLGGLRLDSPIVKYCLMVTLGLVITGLGAAVGHLGNPWASYNAARNVKRSWLSRETLTVSLFAAVLATLVVLIIIDPGLLFPWMVLGESLMGAVALLTMIRVYLLRTVPAWNHAGTPLAFLGSALLLGAVLFSTTLTIYKVTGSPHINHSAIFQNIAIGVMSTGLLLTILAAGIYPEGSSAQSRSLIQRQPVLQTIGFTFWALFIRSPYDNSNLYPLLSLALVFLVAGEIVHRIQFYNSYERVGL